MVDLGRTYRSRRPFEGLLHALACLAVAFSLAIGFAILLTPALALTPGSGCMESHFSLLPLPHEVCDLRMDLAK